MKEGEAVSILASMVLCAASSSECDCNGKQELVSGYLCSEVGSSKQLSSQMTAISS